MQEEYILKIIQVSVNAVPTYYQEFKGQTEDHLHILVYAGYNS
jgi:hypothetical protein